MHKKIHLFALVFTLVLTLCILSGCGKCEHEFTAATCTQAATCSKCGETQGEPLGHSWKEATCDTPTTCEVCGETQGEPLGHKWSDATCTEPETCEVCGETQGEPLGHEWLPATCTEPETCSVCGETQGEALGHVLEDWTIIKDSTCSETGIESGVCTACGETVEVEIPLKDHTPSDWIVTVQPTKDKDGTHVKQCKVCGKELESETFTLSAEEIEKQFKAQCKSISYSDLERNPDAHEGDFIKLSGSVFQVCSEAKSSLYYSMYFVRASGKLYCVYIDNYGSGSRILKGDNLTIWGTVGELYSYETISGAGNVIPSIYAEYYK